MIVNALAGKPLPVYGDGQQRARLALRRRSLRGDPRGARDAAAPGETYNIGGNAEMTQHRRRAHALRAARRELRPSRGYYATLITLRQGPPGPRPPLRDRRREDPRASSAGRRRETFETGLRKTVAGTSTTRAWVAQRDERRVPATGSSSTTRRRREAGMNAMRKGIILAGGSGTRLYPVTQVVSKQLLPVYDKPMIYYPLSTLMLAGIRDILLISTPRGHAALPRSCSATAAQWGTRPLVRGAAAPGRARAGVHHRPRLRRRATPSALVLGDNIFYGHDLAASCSQRADARERRRDGLRLPGARSRSATASSSSTRDGRAISIEEKPAAAEVALRGDRPLFLRQPRRRHRREPQALGARRARDHRRQPRLPRARASSRAR